MALTTQGIKKKRAAAHKKNHPAIRPSSTSPSLLTPQTIKSPPKRARGRPPKHRTKATPNPVSAAKPNRRTCSSYVSPSPILPSCIPPSHVATNQRTTRSNARPTRSASSKRSVIFILSSLHLPSNRDRPSTGVR